MPSTYHQKCVCNKILSIHLSLFWVENLNFWVHIHLHQIISITHSVVRELTDIKEKNNKDIITLTGGSGLRMMHLGSCMWVSQLVHPVMWQSIYLWPIARVIRKNIQPQIEIASFKIYCWASPRGLQYLYQDSDNYQVMNCSQSFPFIEGLHYEWWRVDSNLLLFFWYDKKLKLNWRWKTKRLYREVKKELSGWLMKVTYLDIDWNIFICDFLCFFLCLSVHVIGLWRIRNESVAW